MATAIESPSPRLLGRSGEEQPIAKTFATQTTPKPYWGDWAAMVFWTVCFALMAIIHLVNLVIALFR
jgi:hypothetical protein